ncbi:hypothetical protein TIFTF001_006722 [Ficus carica]|uniref:Amidase domain-containing protein n=1 Tax=Ficus carica TaxID=3494 RepID=A0AA88A151_FICCA|nr:hypothetical protein TIFTF001_006722 [Ficus carica]
MGHFPSEKLRSGISKWLSSRHGGLPAQAAWVEVEGFRVARHSSSCEGCHWERKDELNTTAGSFALLGSVVRGDAGVVAKLREAGPIILGKASLSDWSLTLGRQMHPLAGVSSSGSSIGVAANLVTVSLGTEADGSILCPASFNSVVGIKPTVGLTSRAGVIPISPRQDTVGQRGAVLIDNLEIANIDKILNDTASGEAAALPVEFKLALNAYLNDLVDSPV